MLKELFLLINYSGNENQLKIIEKKKFIIIFETEAILAVTRL